MKTLLRIDCSAIISDSYSRKMANYFTAKWIKSNPNGRVILRDIGQNPILPITRLTIESFGIAKDKMTAVNKAAVALSDVLITELKTSDDVLIATPFYNLTLPATLKGYLEQVVRAGHTYTNTAKGSLGLLCKQNVYFITAKAASLNDNGLEKMDFQEPYLKAIFNHLGMQIKAMFSLEGVANPETCKNNVEALKNTIDEHFLCTNQYAEMDSIS